MSGNARQRKVLQTAIASALKMRGISPATPDPVNPEARLGKNSIEAYVFFLVAEAYAVMSAFGVSVNFLAGLIMSLIMAGSAIHLLWGSIWTNNWNARAKIAGTVLIAVLLLLVVNQGYNHTHAARTPNTETLSAVRNLTGLIGELKSSIGNNQNPTTVIVEPDGRYPDIELDEPVDKTDPEGAPLVTVKETNVGTATAHTEFSSAGLFVAPRGSSYESTIFDFLYSREHDPTSEIPYGDIAPKQSEMIPISGPLRREDGSLANDADRMAVFARTEVFYTAALVSYQDSHGHIFYRELCYFAVDATSFIRKCNSHNGQGTR
jgi:hypothetical protein